MTAFMLQNIPGEIRWKNQPLDWHIENGDRLTITAGEKTDWFVDPAGTHIKDNAPSALFTPPDINFLLSAKVRVDLNTTFDAGVLQLRVNDENWAKLCFEYSPQKQPMIVSVVTRGISDDCNSAVIDGKEIYIRIAKTSKTISFHYSPDGSYWHFVRYFTLEDLTRPSVGFSSQSPTGQTCTAVFSDICYLPEMLSDNRSGE